MAIFLEIEGYQVQQHQEELDFIISKAKGKTNYMEIGVFGGGTFNTVSKYIKGKHIAVDIEAKPERDIKLKESVKDFYSVVGDTHDYATLQKVKDILKGETVDVLFIDGDHSYKGVKRDYEMYKCLVSDGGVVLFHDIIKSDFHKKHNCFVDKFWNELPEPKESVCVSTEWGGVGCIVNKKVKYKCYQIYYDDKSKKGLVPCFTPFDNSKDKSFFFFENEVILKKYKTLNNEKADYIGTTSWKFSQKTTMNADMFIERIESTNNQFDVILFPHAKFLHENVVLRNKNFYSPIYKLMLLIDELNILPFKMQSDKWTCSYNNYWVAKKHVYKDYCERVLIPIMQAFKENEKLVKFVKDNPFNHNATKYPICPFLMELLMGFYVNKFKISHTIITPDAHPKLKPDECWCKVINKALVPEGTDYIKLKKVFAEEMSASGQIKIMEKWK